MLNESKNYVADGFEIRKLLNEKDFKFLSNAVTESWKWGLKKQLAPSVYKTVEDDEIMMRDYHKITNTFDHSRIWTKHNRILHREFIDEFKTTDFWKSLNNLFGDISISDEELLGYENVYWRLVRPEAPKDVGPLHRDEWFWILNDYFGLKPFEYKRLKVWIPLQVEEGLNSLIVLPGSHKRTDIKWHGEKRGHINKPVLDTKIDPMQLSMPTVSPGSVLLFHDKLLHGGSTNKGNHTRVSCEFTLLLQSET